MNELTNHERETILSALRTGTVPSHRLDALAVGMDRIAPVFEQELRDVAGGSAGKFKAIRGEYGSGKTFTVRWMQEYALQEGYLSAEVQISTDTPLYKLETIYRRMMEHLSTTDQRGGALQLVMDRWIEKVEEDVLSSGKVDEDNEDELMKAINNRMEEHLGQISQSVPQFATVLRGYNSAVFQGDAALAQGAVAWLGGQPNVSAATKRELDVSGGIDHTGALSFLRGFLTMLQSAGYRGLMLVLDEVETLQRMRSDTREKSLNALRQRQVPGALPADYRNTRVL